MASTIDSAQLETILKTPVLEAIDPEITKQVLSSPPFVQVPGVTNFRGLGGLPISNSSGTIRPGILFRSANLNHITSAGADRIKELGIGTIFDLRTVAEIRRDQASSQAISSPVPNASPETIIANSNASANEGNLAAQRGIEVRDDGLPDLSNRGVQVIHNPLEDIQTLNKEETMKIFAVYGKGEEGFLEGYERILSIGGPSYGKILRYLLEQSKQDEPKGCLWGCHVGKDRTGVFAGLLLQFLGVPDAEIAKDYALTRIGLEPLRSVLMGQFGDLVTQNSQIANNISSSNAPVMFKLLDLVNTKYGGARKYFIEQSGLTDEELDAIKNWLIIN